MVVKYYDLMYVLFFYWIYEYLDIEWIKNFVEFFFVFGINMLGDFVNVELKML